MGFMSRRVLPVCGSFCVCCPALRTRSRQPVKRYKKLIADVLQEENPNDRKISKLCDYASKNPLRIPKIATSLEQRGYKELRNEHFASVEIIMASFMKLFSSCKGQMPLFATNAINMIKTLVDQTRHDSMRVLGCKALYEFAYNQVDGTYLHHLDALLPSICLLAKETGEELRRMKLRTAGLKALSALIYFMGEHSHICSEYDNVVSAILENYDLLDEESNDPKDEAYQNWVKELVKNEGKTTVPDESSHMKEYAIKFEKPSDWARKCVENLAYFAKEATTTRRVLEPMFCYFDSGMHWSPQRGLGLAILQQFLHCVEKLRNDCFLLPVLVRHLDHKNLNQWPQMKSDIAKVAAALSRQSNSKASVVEIGVLSDMLRHLRNTLQMSRDMSNHVDTDNKEYQLAIQECLFELVKKVGDCTPIYEMMALNLEKLSSVEVVSRSTIGCLLILSQIIVSIPRLFQKQQSFPETLLHQLSLAMIHPDGETRIGAHNIFKILLISTVNAVNSTDLLDGFKKTQLASLSMKISGGKQLLADGNLLTASMVQRQESLKHGHAERKNENVHISDNKELELAIARLTCDQVAVLLSSIWNEANMDNNMPANYEAIYGTYTLILLFSPAKNLSQNIFVRVFQLALSLKAVSMQSNVKIAAARQRSLFILSLSMLVCASRIYNIPGMPVRVSSVIAKGFIDPHLEYDDNGIRSRTGRTEISNYATPSDNESASKMMVKVRTETDISNESLVALILSNMTTSFEMELSSLQEELLKMFSPDKGFAFGLDIQLNAARPFSFDEIVEPKEDLISDTSCADVPQLLSRNPIHTPSPNVLGVNQLLESALATAGQVASVSVTAAPLPYSDVAMRCEVFGTNTRRKMPVWTEIDCRDQNNLLIRVDNDLHGRITGLESKATKPSFLPIHEPWQTIQLPPVSHYDHFLRAAGC